MNHDNPNLLQVELATSRRAEPAAALDPETAELREGWLVLSESLAREQARDDSAFAALVAAELSVAPPVIARANGRRLAVLGALAAVAATALVAVSHWTANESELWDVAEARHSQFASNHDPVTNDSGDSADDWDDPLDGQIASLEEQLGQLAGSPPSLDASLSALDQQLAELADDLDAGSL